MFGMQKIVRHGRLRPLARWHVAVVNKAVEAPDQQAALHRSCSAVRAFLRPCGNKTDGGYPLTDEGGCVCDHAIPM